MEILRMLAGPVIGAVIGYFTNLIAVKMLFYPRREIKLFGKALPFTPGAIPKGQPRLARAIGSVVENNLLTKEDIEAKLLTVDSENKIADAVMSRLSGNVRDELCTLTGLGSEEYEEKKASLCAEASSRIIKAIKDSEATDALISQIGAALEEKNQNSPLKIILNEKTISVLLHPTKDMLDKMIDEHGAEYIEPIIAEKLTAADSSSGIELLESFNSSEQAAREWIISAYRRLITGYAGAAVNSFHVSALVEEKINAMSIDELERLVLTVMKKELNMIVNLGALIGFVLGLFNMLIK